jgi:hypothetical protein
MVRKHVRAVGLEHKRQYNAILNDTDGSAAMHTPLQTWVKMSRATDFFGTADLPQ